MASAEGTPLDAVFFLSCGGGMGDANGGIQQDSAALPRDLLELRAHHDVIEECRRVLAADSRSAYRAALASGVDDILAAYQERLAHVERLLDSDDALTIFHVRFELRHYESLFARLAAVLQRVCSESLAGGRLLNVLHECAADGDTVVSHAFER